MDPNTKRPVSVNWQLLAHYSGKHKMKIRALLLQDLSNPTDSLMQITAEDCRRVATQNPKNARFFGVRIALKETLGTLGITWNHRKSFWLFDVFAVVDGYEFPFLHIFTTAHCAPHRFRAQLRV